MAQRHKRTFTAYDATGREWTIHEYVEIITSRTRKGVEEAEGQTSFETDDGYTVSPLEPYDGKRFEIVRLRLQLTTEKPTGSDF